MYEYRCEYCKGTVKPRTVERESFKHKKIFIILEDVTIGVCDRCGVRPRWSLERALEATAQWYRAFYARDDARALALAQIAQYVADG